LPTLAGKAPDDTLVESRGKRFSRWNQNETVSAELYILPIVEVLLTSLAHSRPANIVFGIYDVGFLKPGYNWRRV
jgi:hypothetical protein